VRRLVAAFVSLNYAVEEGTLLHKSGDKVPHSKGYACALFVAGVRVFQVERSLEAKEYFFIPDADHTKRQLQFDVTR
jgi:hypothetical protein